MSKSEKVLEQIIAVQRRDRCNLFEAAVQYCEENNIDTEDIGAYLDPEAIKRIQYAAVEGRHVRRSVAKPVKALI